MKTGRPKNIESPEVLKELFSDYCKEAKTNPKFENVLIHKSGEIVSVPREIPLTWEGFESYLSSRNVIVRLDDYKSNKEGRYSEFADIIRAISRDIYLDKFNGATVGIFQHNIIARDLGLVDKRETREVHPPIAGLNLKDTKGE